MTTSDPVTVQMVSSLIGFMAGYLVGYVRRNNSKVKR